jgi:hypothetical protein
MADPTNRGCPKSSSGTAILRLPRSPPSIARNSNRIILPLFTALRSRANCGRRRSLRGRNPFRVVATCPCVPHCATTTSPIQKLFLLGTCSRDPSLASPPLFTFPCSRDRNSRDVCGRTLIPSASCFFFEIPPHKESQFATQNHEISEPGLELSIPVKILKSHNSRSLLKSPFSL